MKTVKAFELPMRGDIAIEMPAYAKFLVASFVDTETKAHVKLLSWFEVDEPSPLHPRCFKVIESGEAVPARAIWISTVIGNDGTMVRHIYKLDT